MTMLSSMPPVLPMRKHPGLIPPTVAGPMMPTPLRSAVAISSRVCISGTPSAMIATVLS